MTRSFEIYRDILRRLEEIQTPNCVINANDFAQYDEQEIAYHMRMLHEKGLIKANIMESHDGSNRITAALARRLTDSGHDFLDSMRNDTLWSKIKTHFKERSVDMTIELVIDAGKKIAAAMLLA